MENLVEVINLSKSYGTKEAVKGINFKIKENEILGLLGPNGCGKTTTIGMLLGLLKPSNGQININGMKIERNRIKILEKINFISPYIELPKKLTVKQNLIVYGKLYSVDNITRKIEYLTEALRLEDLLNKITGELSSGQKNRLSLAKALINDPVVLFLDEPTTGLDPASRRVIWDEIKRLNNNGVTVILTTQYLEEADELSDRLLIIDKGVVATEGTSDELKASVGGDVVTFDFEKEENVEVAKRLIDNAKVNQKQLRITVENGAEHIPIFMKTFTENKLNVKSVSANKPTLDDVFLKVTGFSMENDNQSEKKQSKKSNYEKRGRRIRR